MPDALAIQLADAVAALLTAGDYSQEFTAVRKYRPAYDLKELVDVQVTVVPRELAEELSTRAMVYETHQIDVAIRKQLSAVADDDKETAEIIEVADALMYVVQEVRDALICGTLSLADGLVAKCLGTQNSPIYSPEDFDKRKFVSVITAAYHLVRAP